MTGKFRGGVNPFTNGCLRNITYVLCRSQAPRSGSLSFFSHYYKMTLMPQHPHHLPLLTSFFPHLSDYSMELINVGLCKYSNILLSLLCITKKKKMCVRCSHRYVGRWRSPQSIEVQPPFLRPPLTEAQLEAKVLDNGIQNDRHSTRVSAVKFGRFLKPSFLSFFHTSC